MNFDPSALTTGVFEDSARAAATAERRARNKALTFHGSRYAAVNPFFSIPSWWRRFMFIVLTPRELQMYCYICSQSDENGIAYPTYDNIKADLNLSNRTMISKALGELENKGLLLRKRLAPLGTSRHQRNVFQRPSVEYTLYTLYVKGYIDGELRCLIPKPTVAATRRDKPNRNSRAIFKALYGIMGAETYTIYSRARGNDKGTILAQSLKERVERQQADFEKEKRPATAIAVDLETASLEDLLNEEIPF